MYISKTVISVLFMGFLTLTTTASALEYPSLYGDLPKYPNAELLDIGRQQSSLRDGLVLKIVSPDPLKTIVDFYKEGMSERGWTIPPQRFSSEDLYSGAFKKGNLRFKLQVMRTAKPGEETMTIRLNFMEL